MKAGDRLIRDIELERLENLQEELAQAHTMIASLMQTLQQMGEHYLILPKKYHE